ncbi:MAG TPA: DnaA N-terminal domain-containing protein, partial [Candidatus Kapabacteria bacterium]|nr:DnaA N-terminal domain-containing protein [Candidatus Kapabacteria bacterium]
MMRTEFSVNNRTAFAAARLSTNPEISTSFRASDASGILTDVTEFIMQTEPIAPTDPVVSNGVEHGAAFDAERARNAEAVASEASSAMLHQAAQQIWRMCMETIRPQLSAQTMRTWFDPLEATELEGSEITLRAPS